MIRRLNIAGAQQNGTRAQTDQRVGVGSGAM